MVCETLHTPPWISMWSTKPCDLTSFESSHVYYRSRIGSADGSSLMGQNFDNEYLGYKLWIASSGDRIGGWREVVGTRASTPDHLLLQLQGTAQEAKQLGKGECPRFVPVILDLMCIERTFICVCSMGYTAAVWYSRCHHQSIGWIFQRFNQVNLLGMTVMVRISEPQSEWLGESMNGCSVQCCDDAVEQRESCCGHSYSEGTLADFLVCCIHEMLERWSKAELASLQKGKPLHQWREKRAIFAWR
jgi:hypothetical protein